MVNGLHQGMPILRVCIHQCYQKDQIPLRERSRDRIHDKFHSHDRFVGVGA